jgi:hypothetical protein
VELKIFYHIIYGESINETTIYCANIEFVKTNKRHALKLVLALDKRKKRQREQKGKKQKEIATFCLTEGKRGDILYKLPHGKRSGAGP